MNPWRRQLLGQLPMQLQDVLLVYDRDNVLSDEQLIREIIHHRFQVMEVQDQAALRLHYEQRRCSERWLYKIVGEGNASFPYDLIKQHGVVELTLQTAFPRFPRPVLRQLDHEVLDVLDGIQASVFASLSNHEAIELLLRRVYKLSYEMVDTKEEWIAFLIQVHDHPFPLPELIKRYIIEKVKQKAPHLHDLLNLMESKEAFMAYLQMQWEQLLEEHTQQYKNWKDSELIEERQSISGPMIKGMLHHYFMEGKLIPVELKQDVPLPFWARPGVRRNSDNDDESFVYLTNKINEYLGKANKHYKDWIETAQLYGQMKWLQLARKRAPEPTVKIQKEINRQFEEWVMANYSTLASFTAYHQPVMVHHILPFLRYKDERKQALIVLDGMSMVQWKQIKQALDPAWIIEDTGVFAWIPTITEISRRAIFQAQAPRWQQQISEEQAWKQYWMRESVQTTHITFENFVAQSTFDPGQYAAFQNDNIRRAVMIIRNIDVFSHGAIQGLVGMYAEIDVWLRTGYLQDLIAYFLKKDYAVYITSDHGNTECIGIGRPSQGILADTRGERVRIYKERIFRDEAAAQYDSIVWENALLPEDYYYMLAQDDQAFVSKNKRIVSHGSLTLEEVIVPFVRINKPK